MPTPRLPVLIAGAGPTGLTLALALARHGIACRVVDKNPQPTEVSKALAVWSGTLEAFAALGVIRSFLDAGLHLNALKVSDGGRALAALKVAEGVDSAYPFTIIVPQSKTEAILTEHLAAAGVRLERPVELVAADDAGDCARAVLRHADGREETVEADFIVGCDGARSAVRRSLGVEFEGITEPQTFILSDTRMAGDLDPTSIHIGWGPGGSVALFPIGGDVWRTFAMRSEPAGDEPPTLEEIQAHLTANGPPGIVASEPTWLSTFHVNERLASGYRKGRVLIAGDAAHIHSPAGGQGMNTGIQDAFNLGWKLANVIAGRGDAEALLGSYEAERRPVAHGVVTRATQLLRFGMVARGIAVRLVREALVTVVSHIPAARRKLQAQMSETEIVYEAGPLVEIGKSTSGSGEPAVGARALDAEIADPDTGARGPLWPRFSAVRHTLLVFGDPGLQSALMAEAVSHVEAVEIVVLDDKSDPDGVAAERYDISGAGWVLVRPDQFIAARGAAGETRAFSAYAGRALERRPD
jgi:2-polyprenyl-6-methoxyphenol hydroxylase-like FAD-dependent oxidoreductase